MSFQSNLKQSLERTFQSPPRAYSPTPIWWWSGDALHRERLRWQMERFAEGGVYNLIVLNLAPTGPLYGSDPDDPPFFSPDWWRLFQDVCTDARELGMRLWVYDQIGFSGANLQGQLVHETPAFAGQWLESTTVEGEGPLILNCPSDGIPLAAGVALIDEEGRPLAAPAPAFLDGMTARSEQSGLARLRLVYAVQRGFDYFNPRACARLLETIHGAYAEQVGDFFGDVIVGSFQDELPSLPTWGRDFAKAFQERRGYDLVPQLPRLWDSGDAEAHQLRIDYHRTRAELAEEAFFRPLFDWHEQHGLICGFDQQGPARAGYPVEAVQFYADYLRTHRWYAAPGSDHHGEAKIHSSLAHLYDRPRVWIEAFHSSGWGGTLEETFDWLLPWLRAGATLYDPHAVYYSTRGGWWEWAPPSTCWRQPYWRHYRLFADAVSRLCFLLSQGDHVCDVGVLYPTTTVQAGLDPAGQASAAARAAHETYLALVGKMYWNAMQPGVLDRDRRDFDVLDEASVQRAVCQDAALRVSNEAYRALILPSCTVVEEETLQQLVRFVEAGGLLICVGDAPRRTTVGDSPSLGAFQRLLAAGMIQQVSRAEQIHQTLTELPRRVEAPVPTLQRRIAGRDVLFAPAAFPMATRHDSGGRWLDVRYDFDPDRYQRPMQVTVRGPATLPELWDPLDGSRRPVSGVVTEEGVRVEIPFDSGPAALLVWPERDEPAPEMAPDFPPPGQASTTSISLQGPWECELVPTLDNRFGDFAKPDHVGAPPVQTWRFQHRVEGPQEDGLAAGWFHGPGDETGDWASVHATFGVYGWWSGPRSVADLPSPLAQLAAAPDSLAVAGWRPAEYSLSRGIHKDPIHRGTLGPKGHVPEDFLLFGPVSEGEGVQFRTTVWVAEETLAGDGDVHLALAAPAAKELWINGQAVGKAPPGYLWLAPVSLRAGLNLLEFRLLPEQSLNLRAYWALVRDPQAFVRPEWMTTPDSPRRHSLVRFSHTIQVPFAPVEATIQVGAGAPCRVLVNGQEVGRQGGFDPYYSTARIQPYAVDTLRPGANTVTLEVQDLGEPLAVVMDGIVAGPQGQEMTWISGSDWQVQRGDALPRPVRLRRRQWVGERRNVDPGHTHLWRRPHPLPGSAWLEGEQAPGVVLPLAPDAFPREERVEWFSWSIPPGAQAMELPVAGRARLWLDGQEVSMDQARVVLPPQEDAPSRQAVLRVQPDPGCSGGGVLRGPVTYRMGSGHIRLGPWAEQGLESYSGGVRYRTHFSLEGAPASSLVLDLGRVRGVAEVELNGAPLGARIWSPYCFDIAGAARPGRNELAVTVYNTLGPYLDAVSPTHYVFPGQDVSGLMGPVEIQL